MVGRWKRSGVSPMSMALTLAPLRRRTPRTNRGISTILTGRFRGGFANVSAVDTGCLCDRLSGVLVARPGALTPGSTPLAPARLLIGAWRLWSDVGSGPGLVRAAPTPRGSGCTGQGLCVLHEGPPTWSTPILPPVAPGPRALRPDDAGRHPICREQPRLPLAVRHAAAIAVGQSVL